MARVLLIFLYVLLIIIGLISLIGGIAALAAAPFGKDTCRNLWLDIGYVLLIIVGAVLIIAGFWGVFSAFNVPLVAAKKVEETEVKEIKTEEKEIVTTRAVPRRTIL